MGRMDLQAVVYDLISKYELCKKERTSSKTMTCLGLVAFYPEGNDGVKVIAIERSPADVEEAWAKAMIVPKEGCECQ